MRTTILVIISLALTSILYIISVSFENEVKNRKKPTELTIGKALVAWHAQRSFPGKTIHMKPVTEAFEQYRAHQQRSAVFPGVWEAIGPKNFGGRTLALCFNPLNPNTIYAGSASGGLWRSYSAGLGAEAWHRVPTGFPVLGVAAITINPNDSLEMFIGTGEVYNDQNTGTGFSVRTTRGTYGIGILKSTDGGISWSKSLDWSFSDLKGVQDMVMNPENPATIFTATTEGTLRSYDSGTTWVVVDSTRMATDLVIVPGDTSIVFVAAGNSYSPNPGIYRSSDGGSTFNQITNGLPATYSGKALLDICASNTQIMFASIAEQLTGLGLYRSDNQGLSWYQVNSTDYQTYQGWFAHDVLVKPSDPNVVLTSGVDTWKSDDGGITLTQKSYWYNWDFSAITVGGSEGPPDYVHADIHRMYHHPLDDDIVYLVTDGGIFRSLDNGENFEGCNGGYQTQQFYANFSCSPTDSMFAIGGLQDNATAVYEGNLGWRRVIGGDGLSTAIHTLNDQIVYGSSQYLNIRKSTDKAQTFSGAGVPGGSGATNTNFAGPFVLCKSSPDVLYAGRTKVYRTTNGAQNWTAMNNNNELDGNAVLVLEASSTNPNLVYAATAPEFVPQTGLFKSLNGGISWTSVIAGIPNRYILDIAIDPLNNNKVYLTLGGFGTPHLFRTINGGTTWAPWGTGLPDLPINTITIDPLNTDIIYLGNDIGIYVSIDGGLTWQPFNDGLDDGIFVMDISISSSNRKLRLATHGLGAYERDMLPVSVTALHDDKHKVLFTITPNPATEFINLEIEDPQGNFEFLIMDVKGKLVKEITLNNKSNRIGISELQAGLYFAVLTKGGSYYSIKFVKH